MLTKLTSKVMKATIIYDLETRIRKQRKRIAESKCKRWSLYYYNGEYITEPNLTREQIKRTQLPPTNNGQPTIIIAL